MPSRYGFKMGGSRLPVYVGFTPIVPGAGFSGATAQPATVGTSGAFGYDAKVMARWDVVPFQTFTGKFQIGVVAFHINGIDRVEFSAKGGAWAVVRQMHRNPQTGVMEYTAELDAEDFGDELVEIRARVYPKTAGVPRVLGGVLEDTDAANRGEHSVWLMANAGGSLANPVRYVSTTGSDANDGLTLGTAFATTNQAAYSMTQVHGNSDGGTIFLAAGTYNLNGSEFFNNSITVNRWMTLKPAPGVSRDQVTISGTSGSGFNSKLIKFENLNVTGVITTGGPLVDYVWLHNCILTGPGRDVGSITPPSAWKGSFATGCRFTDCSNAATDFRLVRSTTVERVGGDSFSNSGLVANCTTHDLDPASQVGVYHPDVYQSVGFAENVIVYGVRASQIASGAGIQAFQFNNPPTDVAIIDVDIDAQWNLNNAYTNFLIRDSKVRSAFGVTPDFTNIVYENVTFYGTPPTPIAGVTIR
jgi:hypothetical protein